MRPLFKHLFIFAIITILIIWIFIICYKYYNSYFELIAGCNNTSDSSFTDSEDDEELKCDEKFVDSDEFDNFNDLESEESEDEIEDQDDEKYDTENETFSSQSTADSAMVKARKQKEGIYMCVYILYTCIYNYTVCFSFTVSYKYNDCTVNSEL